MAALILAVVLALFALCFAGALAGTWDRPLSSIHPGWMRPVVGLARRLLGG